MNSIATRNLSRRKRRLFMVCPECHTECHVQRHFGEESYFLTALGAVFQPIGYEYAERIQAVIGDQDIQEICIVHDTECIFAKRVIEGGPGTGTKAEATLQRLFRNNPRRFRNAAGKRGQKLELARLNIIRQAVELRDTPLLGHRIEDGEVGLRGLVYDRSADRFEETETDY